MFHFTDINNAANILSEGLIWSRAELEKKEFFDIASSEILSKTDETDEEVKKYARLYFRPRSPMQYRNEGIRVVNNIQLDAHCPVPVYFLFEAIPILEKEDTEFSNGNLASSYSTRDKSVDFYMQIPFNKVYHDKSLFGIDEIERYEIKRNRSAEVLIPKCLDLTYLREICCRSQAEYETLIH